jgi:5-methylcytosine-specific restriction endonuclease McrA
VIRTPSRWIEMPEIVQVRTYDRLPAADAAFTRANLLRRDEHRCQYCGQRPPHSQLTVDHVVPRARGGRTSWENCVAACARCNARKGDRTPGSAGMRLLRAPRAPRWSPFLDLRRGDWPDSWAQFVAAPQRAGRSPAAPA